jgi:hypothetical protein
MQVEAIYDQGRLEFVRPLRLKHDRVRLVVTVPDEELEAAVPFDLPPEVLARAQALRQRLEAIRNAPPPPDEELPELTQRQVERPEAFALRDEIKGLR